MYIRLFETRAMRINDDNLRSILITTDDRALIWKKEGTSRRDNHIAIIELL